MINALIVAIGQRKGPGISSHFSKLEKIWDEYNVYVKKTKFGRAANPGFIFASGGFSMLVYIVRHGETEWNKQGKTQGSQNIGLTDRGRQQALRLGRYLEVKQ